MVKDNAAAVIMHPPIIKYPLETAVAEAVVCAALMACWPNSLLAAIAALSATADLDLRSMAAKNAPTIPPAPTIPEMQPMAFLLMKGTT